MNPSVSTARGPGAGPLPSRPAIPSGDRPTYPAGEGPALPWARSRRIALREFTAEDRDLVVAMHQAPRLRDHLIDDYPLDDPAVADLFLERIAAIYRRHEGLGIWHASLIGPRPEFAGWFNLMPMAGMPGEVEIGSRLLPIVWGGGLALEGCQMLLDHAFDDLGLASVWGTTHPANRSAAVVLHALGFESLGQRPYDGRTASWFRIDLNAWRESRNTPGGTRMRRALRAQATAQPQEQPA